MSAGVFEREGIWIGKVGYDVELYLDWEVVQGWRR
jgi:hypothetical protein